MRKLALWCTGIWLLSGCFGNEAAEPGVDAGAMGCPGAVGCPPVDSFGNRDSGTRSASDGGPGGAGRGGGDPLVTGDPSAPIRADKADILFVVDNSGSMGEEQAALRAQFPHMIRALTSGDADADGQSEFVPIKDLHLGVVSSDMGLVGISGIPNCDGLGDDGVLQHVGDTGIAGCQASYPPFLQFTTGGADAEQVSTDFGCIASLGTEGCGFEQQLESALKALWPAVDLDPTTGQVSDPNRIQFLGDPLTGFGTTGHADGMNAGFLRNESDSGPSLIAIVVVTDEEDCSSADTRHFTPPNFLDPTDPLASQDINLRCFLNPQNLYALDRYLNGFRALRPGQEQLVLFAAIAGVPADLVDAAALSKVDFANPAERDVYYDTILNDPRMQELPDPSRTPEQGSNLTPSCQTDNDGDGIAETRAFPPRRLVGLAKAFGTNGFVQSICQSDFGPAMDAIIEHIAFRIGAP